MRLLQAIVDLLADREAESVKRWLAAHPEVEMVNRDRGGVYIDGTTWGAPQATQVADRWHILSNLGGCGGGVLDSCSHSATRAGSSLRRGRTGPGPQYGAQVCPTGSRAAAAYPAPLAGQSA